MWERRVALLRSDKLDPDMLDERARALLDYVDPRDADPAAATALGRAALSTAGQLLALPSIACAQLRRNPARPPRASAAAAI